MTMYDFTCLDNYECSVDPKHKFHIDEFIDVEDLDKREMVYCFGLVKAERYEKVFCRGELIDHTRPYAIPVALFRKDGENGPTYRAIPVTLESARKLVKHCYTEDIELWWWGLEKKEGVEK